MAIAITAELTLVRHGETLWNLEGRMQGHGDSPLSELGRRQAEALARALAGERFAALYSSDLRRALETARPIAVATGLTIRASAGLRERHFGILQGRTSAQVAREDPQLHALWRGGDPEWAAPGGESLAAKHARAVDCLACIAASHAGERVLVVTHGGVLDAAFRHAVGLALGIPRRFSLLNASLNVLAVQEGGWSVHRWGDVRHLADMDTRDDD